MARVKRLDEGQLKSLVRKIIRENVMDEDGYKIYVLPEVDADLDKIVGLMDFHQLKTRKRWPVLLNGGNRIAAPGEPFDKHYAIGFDEPAEATEFVDQIRGVVRDVFTQDEI
jgi:hypothetical protein